MVSIVPTISGTKIRVCIAKAVAMDGNATIILAIYA